MTTLPSLFTMKQAPSFISTSDSSESATPMTEEGPGLSPDDIISFDSFSNGSCSAVDEDVAFTEAAGAELTHHPLPAHEGYKKVLVTGGAGFLGSHVADALLQRGDDVVIVDSMDNISYSSDLKEHNLKCLTLLYGPERIKIYRGDICDASFLESVFETERPSWVCHMAAHTNEAASLLEPYDCIHSTVDGTLRVLELSAHHGVQNFVFASSSVLYEGSAPTSPTEDNAVDQVATPYAASKRACESLASTYHHMYQLNVTGLRFFHVYGPRERPDLIAFQIMEGIEQEKSLRPLLEQERCSLDFTYVSDIVDGIVRALDRPYPFQIFNLGRGVTTKLEEFVAHLENYMDKTAVAEEEPPTMHDRSDGVCGNIEKAKELLGYQPKVPLQEGIRRTVEWYRQTYGTKQDVVTGTTTTEASLHPSLSLGILDNLAIVEEYTELPVVHVVS